jgi:hypothetical protein
LPKLAHEVCCKIFCSLSLPVIIFTIIIYDYNIKKGKAVPLHAMEALGGERRYSSYSFSTSALDGG